MSSNNDIEKNARSFLLRRYDLVRSLIDRELVDQEPCYSKHFYGEERGYTIYYHTVRNSVIEFIMYSIDDFGSMDETTESEIVESLEYAFHDMFNLEVEEYYFNIDCTEYINQISQINESVSEEELKRLRRIQEVRNTIEFQTEVQDPCNFDDGDEYADFCIEEGLRFFYGDEGYERDDEVFQDEEEDHLRDEITNMMYKEYFDDLVEMWVQWSEHDGEC
jgi:hypothetical protein